jgi:hypothetical protein
MRTRQRERGAALMVTLIIIASLLAGAAVVVSLQMGANRGTDLTRSGMTAEYCAETGMERAAPVVAANYQMWGSAMCGSASEASCLPSSPAGEAAIFSTVSHTIGSAGSAFVLYLRDDEDELTGSQNYSQDENTRVFVVSTCLLFPDTPRQVRELIQLNGGGTNYGQQQGTSSGANNFNTIVTGGPTGF